MTFQEKLYRLRRERGLSQEGLASALGVSRQAVQKWESGAASPDTNNLIVLSDYFGVTLDSLLKDGTLGPAPTPRRTNRQSVFGGRITMNIKAGAPCSACLWCISISEVGAFAGPRGSSR